jgi:AbrB family looped-hinge helix DNA binding protein
MGNKNVVGTSKIGTRGQVTIPKRARDEFKLKPGDIVLFVRDGENLSIRRGL